MADCGDCRNGYGECWGSGDQPFYERDWPPMGWYPLADVTTTVLADLKRLRSGSTAESTAELW